MENPFVLEKKQYKRNLDLLKGYFSQNTLFLHKMTGQPKEVATKFLRKRLSRGGSFPLRDPNMLILKQESPGNRVKDEMTLLTYVKTVTDSKRILSPSMVCYENPEVLKSPTAKFVEAGIAGRKKAKNEMFQAKIAKNKTLEKIKNSEQNAKKIAINSLSGMHGFSGNILYVKSGHSSLTSMCRTATGYGNANNERLLAGARHYHTVDIALANMLVLLDTQPYEEFDAVIQQYNMVYPTVEETAACIRRSTDMYWRNEKQFQKLVDFIVRLDPIERAIIVYTGDMHHIAQYNDHVVRGFFDDIIAYDPSTRVHEIVDPKGYLDKVDGDTVTLGIYLNAEVMRGTSLKDLNDAGKVDDIMLVAQSVRQIEVTLQKYFDFIRVMLTPKALPPTVANIKGILRRVVLASDTDSTIFTTQDWVEWYSGENRRSKAGDGAWYTATYIACQCIVHVLAMFSANMGVVEYDLHRLSMKNEYAFPGFALTSRAKHYYASRSAQEGNVYAEQDMEIKGVALRSSAVPPDVIKSAKKFMKEVLDMADSGEQFHLNYLYHKVWVWEQDIYNSIKNGEHKYLKTGQIQESYANLETSNYRHYILWNEVFGDKYGKVDAPPYSVIKVPLRIRNKTDMKEWMEHIDTVDKDFGARMAKYCLEKNRDQIATLLLPQQILAGMGMPEEVMAFIDIRRLTYEILESFYMILESLGIFQVDTNYVRLISDIYTPSGETSGIPLATDENSALDPDIDFIEAADEEEEYEMELV